MAIRSQWPQRSNVGIKAKEEFAPGWSFVGNVNTDFDPYSLQFANGPESLVENNNKTIGNQSANGDSSRAGQWDNTQGYVGVSNTTFGTLTVGRQNSFSDDAGTVMTRCGGSLRIFLDRQLGHLSSAASATPRRPATTASVKYLVAYNNFRAGAVWQFGGY